MTNDNKPMQADPALFETMSRLTASIPFNGHELGALTLCLETAIESGEQIMTSPDLQAQLTPDQSAAQRCLHSALILIKQRVDQTITYLGIAASGIHAERMDAERNAPTSPNSQ